MEELNVVTAPKTSTFQMRINPEIKAKVEKIFANCGLSLSDAINVFLQQSINAGGLPFFVREDTEEILRKKALEVLLSEIQVGLDSIKSEDDLIPEEEILKEFGVEQ